MASRNPSWVIRWVTWATMAALAGLGAHLLLRCTPHGIGLWEDSFDYISAAENLAAGQGLGRWTGEGTFRPMTHYPPGYPAALAFLHWIGLDIYQAARWMNSVLFSVTVFAGGGIVLLATGSHRWAIVAELLVLLSRTLLNAHAWALSEPRFLTLWSLSVLALAWALHTGRSWPGLMIAAVLVGSADLVRYVGLGFTAGLTAAVLMAGTTSRRRALMQTVAFAGASLAPIGAFMARNIMLTGNPTDNPPLAWHPPSSEGWLLGLETFLDWWFPRRITMALPVAGDLALFGGTASLGMLGAVWLTISAMRSRQSRAPSWPCLPLILVLSAAGYLTLLLFSILFVSRITPLDDRILSPFLLVCLLLVPSILARLSRLRNPLLKPVIAATVGYLLVFSAVRAARELRYLQADGLGFAGRRWKESQVLAYVKSLADVPIYTDEIQAVYFIAGRRASFIPARYNPAEDAPRADYYERLSTMRLRLASHCGALVLFGDPPFGLPPDYLEELTRDLAYVRDFPDGTAYHYASPETCRASD